MVARPGTRSPRALREAAHAIEPLWIAGAVALVLLAARQVLPDQSFSDLWKEYALVGVITPPLVAGAVLLERWREIAGLRALKVVLAIACVALTMRFLVAGRSILLLAPAAAQVAVMTALSAVDRARGRSTRLESLAVTLFVSLAAWAAATQLIWWTPWDRMLASTPFAIVVLAAALVLVGFSVRERAADASRWRPLDGVLTGVGVVLLVVAAFRNDGLFDYAGFHHWSYYVGPAELVRQGHWLLWDVPAQYGFLSTAAIALFPGGTVWGSLFIVSGLLSAASAVIVFLALRSLGRGVLNLVFALGLALSVQFLRYYPGPPMFPGARVYPSTGGLRFIWLLSLMAILLQLTRTGGIARARWFAAGTAVWVIGMLWSFESAVYCSALWLPVCLMLAVSGTMHREGAVSTRVRLLAGARWIAAPAAALGGTVLLICAYYEVRLGELPDWHTFTEFVSAYQAGFFAAPMELGGVVWVLLVLFCALSTGAYVVMRRFDVAPLAVWGAWAALLMTGSYFIGRSHASIVQVLSPVFVMSMAMMLIAFRQLHVTGRWAHLVRMTFVPVLTMLLVSSFGDAGRLADYTTGIRGETAHVTTALPHVNAEVQGLLTTARVQSVDPITFVECFDFPARMPRWDAYDGVVVSDPRAWLPADPYGELLPLSPPRLQTYLRRFVDRAPRTGWFMQCKSTRAPLGALAWVTENYRATQALESPSWRLTRYTRRPG